MLNVAPRGLIDGGGRDVADDDGVELQPLLAVGGECGSLGVAELPVGGRGDDRRRRGVGDLVRVEQDILEVDGFFAGVEEVAQVAELPAGVAFDDQDVGAIVGDRDFEIPTVIIDEGLAGREAGIDGVLRDADLVWGMGEAQGGAQGVVGDFDFFALEELVALEEGDGDRLAAQTVKFEIGLDDGAVVEVDGVRDPDVEDTGIFRTDAGADDDRADRCLLEAEAAGGVFDRARAVVAAIAEQDDSGEAARRDFFEDGF